MPSLEVWIFAPLLAHLFPLKFVIPMMVVLDCIGSISMGVRLRADVNTPELKPMLPFMVVGMVAGAFLLLALPPEILLGTLGVFILAYGGIYVAGRQASLRVGRWAAPPVGLVAGTTSSMFGVGGPIYVMYLTARGSTLEQIRATMPVIFIFTTIARIIIFIAAGLFSLAVLYTSLALLPVMVLGMWLGNRVRLNLSREELARVVGVLLVVSGASLLFRAATG